MSPDDRDWYESINHEAALAEANAYEVEWQAKRVVTGLVCPESAGGCGEQIHPMSDTTVNSNFEPMHTTCYWSACEAAESAADAAGCE